MNDNCVLEFLLPTFSMNSETAVTLHFAVILLIKQCRPYMVKYESMPIINVCNLSAYH